MIRWLDARKGSVSLFLLIIAAIGIVYYQARRPPDGELVVIDPDGATNFAR